MHGIILIQLQEQELLDSTNCQGKRFIMEQMEKCAMGNNVSMVHGIILIQ